MVRDNRTLKETHQVQDALAVLDVPGHVVETIVKGAKERYYRGQAAHFGNKGVLGVVTNWKVAGLFSIFVAFLGALVWLNIQPSSSIDALVAYQQEISQEVYTLGELAQAEYEVYTLVQELDNLEQVQ